MATNQTPPDVFATIAGRQDWRAALERDYQAVSARLQAAYQTTQRQLAPARDALVTALEQEAQRRAIQGRTLTAADVEGLSQYQQLLLRVEAELDGFARLAERAASDLAGQAIARGLDDAAALVQRQAGLYTGWLRPDPAALERLIGYVDSGAFRAGWARFGANAATNVADTILAYTAQGKGPRAIARALSRQIGVPFSWADNSVRTVQNWSYRGAAHAAYAANPRVVEGWLWRAALDTRTCLSCVAMHGTRHTNDEILNDHWRGRCTPVPIVVGTTWADNVETGPAWFARQDAATQRDMMGPGLFEAWRHGRADFRDFSRRTHSDVYGTMLRQASNWELGIGRRR
jgi:hypothetical protein